MKRGNRDAGTVERESDGEQPEPYSSRAPLGPSRLKLHLGTTVEDGQGPTTSAPPAITGPDPHAWSLSLEHETDPPRRSAASGLARVFFFGWILVQLAVPVWRRGTDHHPTRFGWEMFSSVSFAPLIQIERSDGSTTTAQVREHMGAPRMDVEYGAVDWTPVCERIPDAVRLKLHFPRQEQPLSWECPRS